MAKRVLSGLQPSGVLHLGNLFGALDNFLRLQAEHECFYFVADWHALSTNYEDTTRIREYTREVLIDWLAAGLDALYKPVFPEPQALLTEIPKVPGTDGRKMSKSYNNTINLSDSEATVRAKLKTMVTDPARVRRTDKGNPDVCPVFTLHKSASKQAVIDRVNKECRTAEIGCLDCKSLLADALVARLTPIWEKRRELVQKPKLVDEVIAAGTKKASAVARHTIAEVNEAMKIG